MSWIINRGILINANMKTRFSKYSKNFNLKYLIKKYAESNLIKKPI
jgi:hypothetical protein